jgi:hypothetical protein
MTDEGIWLLLFGREWIALEALEAGEQDHLFSRLARAKKLEVSKNFECVRLKEKE